MKKKKTRRLVAIMFTDIVGYTSLMQENEEIAAATRARHRQVFNQTHDSYNGEILQYFGDGTLSVFQSGVEAVECAIAIQKDLQTGKIVPLRIGLHLGDIVFDGTEIYGDSVNLTARIESMGVPGAVLLSGRLNEELQNHPQITTVSLGHFGLKNITKQIEVFAIKSEGLKIPEKGDLKGKQKEQTKTIAVLPFVNISSKAENEYFSDGMTEEIINALAKIKSLKVTSRTSAFFFKNKNIPISKIGKELNVSTILEGSIRLAGNKMRITAQLIDVNEDYHFWSETFDRSIDDIFALQDEISLLIADKLREHIGHFEMDDTLVDAPDIPVEVYKKYLQSRYYLLKMSRSNLEKGMQILEDIIKEEPHFALAHLGMHLGYTLMGMMGLTPPKEAFMKGYLYLEKAIAIDENLPECQLHLSYATFLQKWDLPATYQHLNKAFEIRPSVEYYQSMASTLVAERKFEAAHNYIKTALQLDPFSEITHHLHGFIYYAEGQFDPALKWFEKAIKLKPSFVSSIFYKGQTLILLDQAQKALSLFTNLLPDDVEGDLTKQSYLTLAHAALGDSKQMEMGIKKLEDALDTNVRSKVINALILIYAILNNEKKTLHYIDLGIKERLPMMVYILVEPFLKSLHGNPKFEDSIQKVLGSKTAFKTPKRKYKKALFEISELRSQKLRLEQLMLKEQPYLDPNLTLRSLAQLLDVPPNHLSQLLNEGFDKNFSEFVNSYRLETFKSKVANPSFHHLTILAIAYESGFNSKTVFNTFFKKMMGKTPKAYWKEIVQ